MKTLDVFLREELVGHLWLEHGRMVFSYGKHWLEQADATPLSASLPLRPDVFRQRECRAFFAGLLPEEDVRTITARNLGISRENDFAMLEAIGGECAGAVTVMPEGQTPSGQQPRYATIGERQLVDLLRELPTRPMLAGDEGTRLSLAGAQSKLSVFADGDAIAIPLYGAPSTHIIKTVTERFPDLVFNEAFCLQLASLVGLHAAKAEVRFADDIPFLLVERYDRIIGDDGSLYRLHQEDFCQALGVDPDHKYQSEGGPDLVACCALIQRITSVPSVAMLQFADAVFFNVVIGNHDAHGKNFSILYAEQDASLAPLYDLVSTVWYPHQTVNVAMSIGKERRSLHVSPEHIAAFAQAAGLSVAASKRRMRDMIELVREAISNVDVDHPVAESLTSLILERCSLLASRFRP